MVSDKLMRSFELRYFVLSPFNHRRIDRLLRPNYKRIGAQYGPFFLVVVWFRVLTGRLISNKIW